MVNLRGISHLGESVLFLFELYPSTEIHCQLWILTLRPEEVSFCKQIRRKDVEDVKYVCGLFMCEEIPAAFHSSPLSWMREGQTVHCLLCSITSSMRNSFLVIRFCSAQIQRFYYLKKIKNLTFNKLGYFSWRTQIKRRILWHINTLSRLLIIARRCIINSSNVFGWDVEEAWQTCSDQSEVWML